MKKVCKLALQRSAYSLSVHYPNRITPPNSHLATAWSLQLSDLNLHVRLQAGQAGLRKHHISVRPEFKPC